MIRFTDIHERWDLYIYMCVEMYHSVKILETVTYHTYMICYYYKNSTSNFSPELQF